MKTSVVNREAGFTLIELMMVVFVVGIMAGLVVMSIGGNTGREFRRDAARIQQVLVMAQDEASFSGQEIGFSIARDEKSYSFLSFDDKQLTWQPLQKEAFMQRNLPESFRLDLDVGGTRIDLGKIYKESYGKSDKLDNWLTKDDKTPAVLKIPPPWLIFFSDGHYTPFRMQLSDERVKDKVYVIEGDGVGSVRMSEMAPGRKAPVKKRKSAND